MAENSDDPVLEIRVTGDWSEFDRQAEARESSAQSTGMVIRGAGTFGSEAFSGRSGSYTVTRMEAAQERLASAVDRQALLAERSPVAGLLPFYGLAIGTRPATQDQTVVPTRGTSQPYYPEPVASPQSFAVSRSAPQSQNRPGAMGIGRWGALARQTHQGQHWDDAYSNPADDFEGSWTPRNQRLLTQQYQGVDLGPDMSEEMFEGSATSRHGGSRVDIPGAGGGGRGGGGGWRGGMGAGGLPGPQDPYSWTGRGFAGTYGQGVTGWATRMPGPTRAFRAGQAVGRALGSVSTGVYYAAMFGLYEVGAAARASHQAQLEASVAGTTMEALQAEVTGIDAQTGGILGSIVGLGKDALSGVTGWESPSALREAFVYEQFKETRWQKTYDENLKNRVTASVNRGRMSDMFTTFGIAAQSAQISGQATAANAILTAERSRLREQLSATHETFFQDNSWSEFGRNLTGTGTRHYDLADPSARSAALQRIQQIDQQISTNTNNAAFDVSFAQFQRTRAIETEVGKMRLEASAHQAGAAGWKDIEAGLPASQAAVNQAMRKRTLIGEQFDFEEKQAAATPELIPAILFRRKQAMAEADAEVSANRALHQREESGAHLEAVGFAHSSYWQQQRMPVHAALDRNYYESEAAAARNPARAGRIRAAAAIQAENIRAAEAFESQQELTQVTGSNRTLNFVLQNNTLEAIKSEIKTQRELALAAVSPERPDVKKSLEEHFELKEKVAVRGFNRQRNLARYGMQAELDIAKMQGDYQFEAADIEGIARGATGRAMALASQDPEQSKMALEIGQERLRGYRANYFRQFRGEEVESLSRVDLSGGRSTSGMNAEEVVKKLDEQTKALQEKIDQGIQKLDNLVAGE